MRITTNWKDAVDDPGNRSRAAEYLRKDDPRMWEQATSAERGQWVTDLISEWVDQLKHDIETGAYDER